MMKKIVFVLILILAIGIIAANVIPRKPVFRIDDVWAFEGNEIGHNYTFENLKKTLELLKGQKIVLGVTPFFFDGEKEIALENELIEFLQQKQAEGMDIAMHGYNHKCDVNHSCEFDNKDYFEYMKLMKKGKNYLEDYFGRISIFIPPKNNDELGLKQAVQVSHMFLYAGGYDPTGKWYWFENKVEWKGFEEYDGEEIIIIHYNAVNFEELQQFVDNLG